MRRSRSFGDSSVCVDLEKVFNHPRQLRSHYTRRNMADHEDPNRSVRDYASPQLQDVHSSIRRPAIQAHNFELKPALIQMVQNTVQFGGLPSEDPGAHLSSFLEVCDTFRHNGISEEGIRLRLFPFSLRDKAKAWLSSLPANSITTWEELAQKFLAKFFPPIKTARLRSDITSFKQIDGETLYEAWERFKEMLRKCPHHGIPKWLQVQTVYMGLLPQERATIDAAAGGALMARPVDAALDLLEEMAANNYQWPTERNTTKKVAGMYEVDALTSLSAQVAAIAKRLDNMNVNAVGSSSSSTCDLCGDPHSSDQCPHTMESVQFLAQNRQSGPNRPFNNNFNQGGRGQGNYAWGNNKQASSSFSQPKMAPNFPPGFQPQPTPPKEHYHDRTSTLESMFMTFINKTDAYMTKTDAHLAGQDALLQSQAASLRNLETQMGQIAQTMNNRPLGTLPSDTINNPKGGNNEQCKAITLKSGKEIEGNPKTKFLH